MSGWRTGFDVAPRPQLRVLFSGGGAGAMRPSAPKAEVAFRGGGAGSLSTKAEIGFRGGGSGHIGQKSLISFMGGGAGTLGTAAPTWATGYAHYLEFLIPSESVIDGPHTNFPFLIDETFSELRTVANGGLVRHASGFDMLLTMGDDTPVDFARRTWDATTGRIVIRSRIPTLLAADNRVRLYFGKSGVTVDGASQSGAYAAYLLALDCRTGADLTGQGRTFTPANVDTGTLIDDAGEYNGSTSRMQLSSFAAANGLAAITVEAFVAPQDTPNGCIISSGPTAATGDPDLGLTLGYNNPGAAAGAVNTIAFKVRTSAGAARIEAPANSQAPVDVPQFLAGVWQSGQAAKLFVDTAFVTASNTTAVRTGSTLVEAGGPTSVGWSPVGPQWWAGTIDELCISARALSEGFLRTQRLNYLSRRDFYGVGEVNSATATNLSPVLPPIFATATVGAPSIVDAALRAYEGDSGQVKTLESLTGSGGGTSTIASGRAQFTPSTEGEARRIATVKDNASPVKRSLAPIIWMASAAPETGPRPQFPATAVTTRRVPEDGTLTQVYALAAASGGDHISVADGTYAGNFTFGRPFPTANPTVIKSRSLNGAVFTGRLLVTGVGHHLHELKNTYNAPSNSDTGGAVHVTGNYFTMTRCWLTGRHGITVGDEPSEIFPHHVWIGWNRFTGSAGTVGGVSHIFAGLPEGAGNWLTIDQGPHDLYIYRNFLFDVADNTNPHETHHIYFGNSQALNNLGRIPECYVEYNLIYNDGTGRSRARGLYLKRGCVMRYNDCNLPQGTASEGYRHGRGGEIYGNTIRGPNQHLNINGGDVDEFTSCYGNAVEGNIRLWAGSGPPAHQAADYAVLAGNRKHPSGTLTVVLGQHVGTIQTAVEQGGRLDHVTIYRGDATTALSIDESQGTTWFDDASCDTTARAGWGPFSPVTPITLTPIEVGQGLADQR